ncbi:MAG: GNAT family N-acetyltransferase [Rubrivivax sp.]|nr:GNAT family N-acetyltransferase [Rubrivivax sp.]
MTILHTARLRLEPFDSHHFDGLQAMNRLPEVARYLSGQPETPEQTQAAIARVQRCWAAWGTSWWAFIEYDSERLVGAGCIQYLRRDAVPPPDPMDQCSQPMEIGWRLHPDVWHRGLATEAARRMGRFAFESFPITELLAVRHVDNVASGQVMDRLGMQERGLETWYGATLATHVLSRERWQQLQP